MMCKYFQIIPFRSAVLLAALAAFSSCRDLTQPELVEPKVMPPVAREPSQSNTVAEPNDDSDISGDEITPDQNKDFGGDGLWLWPIENDYPIDNASIEFEFLKGKRVSLINEARCRPEVLERGLVALGSDVQMQGALTESFIEECSEHLRSSAQKIKKQNTLESRFKYAFWKDSRFKLFQFETPDRFKIRGLLGLKDTAQALPLVIVKLGTLSDLMHPGNSLYLTYLFDSSPFNVLILESTTSPNAILENRELMLGGLVEGIDLHKISQFVMSPYFEFHTRFSEVHLIGMSLGGHSALYSSLYDSAGISNFSGRGYASALAMCPAVDLKPAVEQVFPERGFRARLTNFFFLRWLKSIFLQDPFLESHIFSGAIPGEGMSIVDGLGRAATRFFQSWRRLGISLKPLDHFDVDTQDDYWQANNFLSHNKKSSVPVFAMSAMNDDVVPYESGVGYLKKSSIAENIGTVRTEKGRHCRFSYEYGWDFQAAIIRGLILSRSPSVLGFEKKYAFDFEIPRAIMASKGTVENLYWSARLGEQTVDLVVVKRVKGGVFKGDRLVEYPITFSYSDFDADFMPAPADQFSVLKATRFFNSRVRIATTLDEESREPNADLQFHWYLYQQH